MLRTILSFAVFGAFVAGIAAAQSTPDTLTAERVLALARSRAPEVRAAEARVLEARGRLAAARAFGRENPSIEGVAAREDRFERRTQWELSVPVGIGLGWAGRNGVASAELERDRQLLADVRRSVAGAALAAYYRVLHSVEGVELARRRLAIAGDLQRAAAERFQAGEIPKLEAMLAETEDARAHAALLAEERNHARERMALAAVLGLPSGEHLAVTGDLADRSLLDRAIGSEPPPGRADVVAAEREVKAAGAARNLARTELLPGLAFRLNYGHEAGEAMVQPGMAITVPLFQYGQESRATARAREFRAVADLERTRNAAGAELEGTTRAYAAAREAAGQLATRAIPNAEAGEGMVSESYRAGKIDFPTLLVIRRDLLETRRDYLDRLLDAALAGIDLAVARGVFQ